MENKDILNFSHFFGADFEPKPLNRDDFKDLYVTEDKEPPSPDKYKHEEPEVDDSFDPPVDIHQFEIEQGEPEELDFENSLPEPEFKLKESKSNYYTLYNDKSENFVCDVYVEGAKINETQARLIIESEEWNLIFEGEIDRYGKCQIPIKKLNIFQEGVVGKIRLEVIAENTVFTPWNDDFQIKTSKKVLVKIQEKRSTPETPKRAENLGVKVNLRR